MAEMIARIRMVVDVPFEFNLEEPDETGHTDTRIEAAKYAEKDLVEVLANSFNEKGNIVDVLIEEVREAS